MKKTNYSDFKLNSTGKGKIKKTGMTKLEKIRFKITFTVDQRFIITAALFDEIANALKPVCRRRKSVVGARIDLINPDKY